jgi:hypothetical protein
MHLLYSQYDPYYAQNTYCSGAKCGGVLLGSKIGKGKNVCDKPNGNLFPLQP